MPRGTKQTTGYIRHGTEDYWLAQGLSKSAWIDLYVDVYRQAFGEETSLKDVLADAYARLVILEANGIRERSQHAATAWRKHGK